MLSKKLKEHILNWLFSDEEECDCEERETEKEESPAIDTESIDTWVPPARYCIRAGGIDIWADNYRFGPGGFSIELVCTQKIGSVEKVVSGFIVESNYMIFDYESTMTSNVFDKMQKANTDFTTKKELETEDQDDAKMKIEKECTIPQDAGVMSAYA
jgi:hypothetical protein